MTTAYRKVLERSQTCVRRIVRKPAWDCNRCVSDPRQVKGRRWQFPTLMRALWCGFLTHRASVRAVERVTECGCDQRLPDFTRSDCVGQCSGAEVADLRRQLHAQVRTDGRSQSLDPVDWPCRVVAVENKTVWTGPVPHAHAPHAQVVHPPQRAAYAQVRAVRSVLRSAASKPAMAQVAIRAATHAGGMLPEVFEELEATDAALIEIDSLDAGLCAQAHARLLAEAHTGSRMGLTGNQPELFREAERGLGAQTHAACRRAWEPSQGDQLRDHLSRTTAREASRDWSHLKQVWRVEKEIRNGKSGRIARENRDSVTNLPRGRLTPEQILAVIRAHWAIENHGHWTRDVIWDEESQVWCGQGVGRQVLGLLRVMAYTVVSLWRYRSVCHRAQTRAERRRWQEWCDRLFLLRCHAGRTLFPPRQVTVGI